MSTPIIFYNTLSHQRERFKPHHRRLVTMYTCGPTVYNYAHIGNLRTYIFEDVLKRVLLYNGYKVKHVMNITDVGHLTSDADEGEDKMEKGSKREGRSAWDIAAFYTAAFFSDIKQLNIILPEKFPRATDHIREQIHLVKRLERRGYTYRTVDGIYFDTSKLPDYGKLANLQKQELKAGARIDIGDKKNITDFALWKFSPTLEKRQMEWKSPWGVGFPGWHLECSAMSTKYLGQPFDIHCGGIDHIPVHHTNEIAESEAAYNKPLANYWLHGEFLLIDENKMAKSGENFITLATLRTHGFSPLAYRYFVLQTYYRKQLNFSWEALGAAETALERLYAAARLLPASLSSSPKQNKSRNKKIAGPLPELKQTFLAHINSDLDIPTALGELWSLIREKKIDVKTLLDFDRVLGLGIKEHLREPRVTLPNDVKQIVTERNEARAKKNWAESDRLRAELEKLGYEVNDSPSGTTVKKKRP